jgi:hypothetical protein
LASRIMESRWPAGVEMRFAGRSSSNWTCEFARLIRRKFIGMTLDTLEAICGDREPESVRQGSGLGPSHAQAILSLLF